MSQLSHVRSVLTAAAGDMAHADRRRALTVLIDPPRFAYGIAAAQGYPQLQRFEAAIVDLGIGIRRSLAENPQYTNIASDLKAIETALQLGVTSKPGDTGPTRHSGYGLTVTQHLLQRNGGRLVVRSGSGEVHVGAKPLVEERQVDFPGTLVVMEAWTDAPLDVAVVYRELLGDLDE